MAGNALRPDDRSAAPKVLKLLQSVLWDFRPRDFAIELWDGTRWTPERNQFHRFTWKINNPDALRAAFYSCNRQVALGEAYVRGDFDIIGDIEAVFPLTDYLVSKKWSMAEKLHFSSTFAGFPGLEHRREVRVAEARLSGQPHSRKRDKAAVTYHYDVSNDFYSLWLDRNMLYSCAYFEDPADSLETAQVHEMNRICDQLCLRRGE